MGLLLDQKGFYSCQRMPTMVLFDELGHMNLIGLFPGTVELVLTHTRDNP
jgi:hypothetical protein